MKLVVDSSAVVEVLLERTSEQTAKRLLGFTNEPVIAPALMWSEAMSALTMQVWKGSINADIGKSYLNYLFNAKITLQTADRFKDRAFEIARDMGWARTYDAEYCALADLEEATLVTADLRMMKSAQGRLPYIVAVADL